MKAKDTSENNTKESDFEQYLESMIEDVEPESDDNGPNDNLIPLTTNRNGVKHEPQINDHKIKAEFTDLLQHVPPSYHYECNICYKSFKTKEFEKNHMTEQCSIGKFMKKKRSNVQRHLKLKQHTKLNVPNALTSVV